MRKGSCSPPGPNSPTGYSSSANGICGRSWPSTRSITTDGDPIAAVISARLGPATPSPASPASGSGAGPSSAASSTSTSELHRRPGQDQRPSSGTPQGGIVAVRWPQVPGPVRAMAVVMGGISIQHGTQVPWPDDEHPVGHLGPDRADPAFGI